ncbi:putative NMT1/THI5 like fused with Diguanylate cyclase [Vibrio nigripulchritudo SFn27]|uniref:diguanylate cyclase n=1 Tax=Vibrio nigripulchritudo TaxID=28173 RepID=U4KAX0_9VIBR|nr:GGDEF domain-containing protein [Vibrio nigripulchritudo]CCN83882.1 putative NMT1/THI5 like fused with Diguanylate cyclase [Vibrio nigripulchritudo BLFn1]CCN89448.1 putative NMT1/THI5 like fused with Diguanylate cyclase [Vibrio nigripulchritudo SFn27]CCN92897.1 putative NMT1/THI5 like fused with Diguanylate cyclase [Vibrio nigripulchritudo ENn2]CCO40572.1 putative NMT1/THI5 like fused with Diguanylate cyclase [Vibrio nigripulchritudo SFn135]CCO55858.1 putative NMT1/THI5 like fused with Digu
MSLTTTRFFTYLSAMICSAGSVETVVAQETINVGLRWVHQFQFAGYYAAIDQGYYAEKGFHVNLVQGSPNHDVSDEVLAGTLDFGIANGELVLQRLRGEPLVAIAATFQYSPSVLVSLSSSGIRSPKDLEGKTIMTVSGEMYPSYLSMLSSVGVDVSSIRIQKTSFDIQDLVNGRVDAFNAYLPNEPYLLKKQNIDFTVLNPRAYGVDFYSDFIFTRESLVEENPELVDEFREATLRGWRYALDNPEEIIQLIKAKYNSEKSLDELRYEALAISNLVRSNLVDIGYINETRVEKMASILIQENLAHDLYHLDGLVYRAEKEQIADAKKQVFWLSFVLISLTGVCTILILLMRRLKQEMIGRRKVEKQLRHLASVDPLTSLYNRRMFASLLEKATNSANRTHTPYCLVILDIDLFKGINDQYGHSTGDRVIMGVADTIRTVARGCDVCARFGGEEFIILLPDTKLDGAKIFASRLKDHVGMKTFHPEDENVFSVTCSFGVVEWELGISIDELISRADDALYEAKRSGRNRICTHISEKSKKKTCAEA